MDVGSKVKAARTSGHRAARRPGHRSRFARAALPGSGRRTGDPRGRDDLRPVRLGSPASGYEWRLPRAL